MLAALGSELDISYQHDGTYSNKVFGDVDTHREVRLLDAIAVALTTGNPGDVFTATSANAIIWISYVDLRVPKT